MFVIGAREMGLEVIEVLSFYLATNLMMGIF
jgi:hypothetical protein